MDEIYTPVNPGSLHTFYMLKCQFSLGALGRERLLMMPITNYFK